MLSTTLRTAVHLALKDLRLYARDKGGLALGFLLPIALITVFALVFGGMGGDGSGMPRPDVRVADFDGTDESRALIAALGGDGPAAVKEWKGAPPVDRDEVLRRVKKGEPPIVLVVGAGFGRALAEEREPPLELVRDTAKEMEGRLVEQALMVALMTSHGDRLGRLMTRRGVAALGEGLGLGAGATKMLDGIANGFFDRFDAAVASRPADGTRAEAAAPGGFSMENLGAAFGLKITKTGGESLTGGTRERNRIAMISQSVAGTAVMMLLFGLVACGTTLLEEREGGTLRRLMASPAPRLAVLLGKFLYCFAVGFAQLMVMFAFGRVAFGLPVERHLGGVVVFGAATAAAATGFGVLLAVVGRSRKQVEGLSTMIILVMSAVGGSWFPLMLMPEWMRSVSRLTLNAWAMEGFNGLFWYDRSLAELLLPLGVLCGVAAALFAVSGALFKRRFA